MPEQQLPPLPLPALVLKHHGATISGPMREWIAQGHVPPVLLLTGTQGIGKRDIAHFLAQWLFCEKNPLSKKTESSTSEAETADFFGGLIDTRPALEPNTASTASPEAPCGQCPSCQRAVHGNWVDFKEIIPEPESTTLKIDQFRELKATLGFGAHEGAYRITFIPNADRMTPQAANSLLKLLEEPPPGWVFFLTASDATLILPTVLSRCQTLRLKPFSHEMLEALLLEQGVDRNRAIICARLAQGSWIRAQSLANDELWARRQLIFSFIRSPYEHVNALVDWAALELDSFGLLTDQLEYLLHDLLNWSVNPQRHSWFNADGKDSLGAHANHAVKVLGSSESARQFWLERAERLARSRHEVLTPMNRKLLLQDLLLPWVSIQKKR